MSSIANRFVWLDDNPERRAFASTMQEVLGIEVGFRDLKGRDIENEIAALLNEEEPLLIILDQNLFEATNGTVKKGSTAAAIIREKWTECPIVCVTGEDIRGFSNQQRILYEEVFPINSISKFYSTIKSIAESFNIARSKKPTNTEELYELLGVPENDAELIKAILPSQLKDNFDDTSLIVEISRWVRGVLLKRPGFLYNKLWLSTLLGIKSDSFEKIEAHFAEAKYKGLFADENNPRWWKSKSMEILYVNSESGGYPWERGRGLQGISDEDHSVCFYSGEPFPETVAFIDETSSAEEAPMKIKHTIIHPEFESMLYFEDIRLMQAAE